MPPLKRWILVWIDFQHIFTSGPEWNVEGFQTCLKNTRTLSDQLTLRLDNRSSSLCQIATRFVVKSDTLETRGLGWQDYYRHYAELLNDTKDALSGHPSRFELVEVPAPYFFKQNTISLGKLVDQVVDSTGFSKWSAINAPGTGLALDNRTDEIILAGLTTSCCVQATAFSAVDAGFRVHIVSECCVDENEWTHSNCLLNLSRACGPNLRVWQHSSTFLEHILVCPDRETQILSLPLSIVT